MSCLSVYFKDFRKNIFLKMVCEYETWGLNYKTFHGKNYYNIVVNFIGCKNVGDHKYQTRKKVDREYYIKTFQLITPKSKFYTNF